MLLKIITRSFGSSSAYRAKSSTHHSVLPMDTFTGKTIEKSKVRKREAAITKYGGKYTITLLPGIPPGEKMMKYVREVYKTARVPIDFEEIPYSGTESFEETLKFNEEAISSMHRNGLALKGNLNSPHLTVSENAAFRTELDLYVSCVHIKSYKNVKCRYPNLNLYICRQNTEGEYSMLEYSAKKGLVESMKIITRQNTERLAKWTFEMARQKNRKKVTIVHKANIMKVSDGLFMSVVKDVAKGYPELKVDDIIIDNCTMQLVQNPQIFDVLITPNLYGNILTSIACGLTGGPGLMSGRNYGDSFAVFEAGSRHLTFLEDEKIENPVATLNASLDLLKHLGMFKHATLIRNAIIKTISIDRIQTKDIGGTHSSDEVVATINENIKEELKHSDIKQF